MQAIAFQAQRKRWVGSWHCAGLLALMVGLACGASGGPLQLITTLDPSLGPAAGGGGDSCAAILSLDGRYVLFASTANNLVLTDNTNPLPALFPARVSVFLRDRTNGTTTLVSADLTGTRGGNGDSWPSALSANARYALFESSASDLVPGDTNGLTDIFVRDLVAGSTVLVTVSTNGGSANGVSRSAVMTPDGRYVAFVSEASNLVPGDTNGIPDVFVRDLQAGTTTLASVGARSVPAPSSSGIWGSGSEVPEISSDGRYVAFYCTASNLVHGVQTVGDIYVRDLAGGTTVWASTYARTATQALLGKTAAVCFNHALSTNGQYVAYEARPIPISGTVAAALVLRYNLQTGLTDVIHTNATVPGGSYQDLRSLDMTPDGRFIAFIANTNANTGVTTCAEVWDAQTGSATLASANLSGIVPAGSTCDWPALDASGRFLAFLSSATNVVTNVIVGDYHLYVRDMQAGSTVLVDGDTNQVGSPITSATVPQLSADGRYVAFECPDMGLVPNDRNRAYDVFVRDLAAGTNELISARDPALASMSGNGLSALSTFSVSADGRYVAFVSDANNLVPNDTNSLPDIFVRDLVVGTNTLVTVGTNGVAADSVSFDPAISGNSRYVAFTSIADNLVAGDSNKAQDVFVRDFQAGTTSLVSINTAGSGPGNGNSYSPSISADGRFVLFHSLAQTIAAGSFAFGYENLFLRDRQLGTNYALTIMASGTPIGAMTPDGRFVAFWGKPATSSAGLYVWDSLAARLVYTDLSVTVVRLSVSQDGNRIAYTTSSGLFVLDWHGGTTRTVTTVATAGLTGPRFSGDGRWLAYAARWGTTNEAYLYDYLGATNLLVSRGYMAGEPGNAGSDSPDVSADARFVAYRSSASNLVPGDTNGLADIFLYDRQTSTTTLLSASRLGPWAANNRSQPPVFSADGQTLVFQSWASDLVAQDFNQGRDVFAYSLYASGSIPVFAATLLRGSNPGQGPWIMWPVVPGKTYSVEFKNSLHDPQWQPLAGSVTVVGSQAYLNDPSPGAGAKFYRVSAY